MFKKQQTKNETKEERKQSNALNRGICIGIPLGALALGVGYFISKKLDKPVSGNITYSHVFSGTDVSGIQASVWYKNRFGMNKNPLNIAYELDSDVLKALTDNLNKIYHPGD